MPTTLPPINHEKAYQIACTGAVDNVGGSGVDTYLIYAESYTGSPADPLAGNFENAIKIGELTELELLPCYYKDSSKANWNELKLRQSDGTPVVAGTLPRYGADNVYMLNWRDWDAKYKYRIWILSIDKFKNKEALNTSGTNSLTRALHYTGALVASELTFLITPTINVLEGSSGDNSVSIDANGNEYSTAEITFGNMQENIGTVRSIKMEYKQASQANWKPFAEYKYHPDIDNMSESGAFLTEKIILDSRPVTYDFRATFLNYNNEPAEDSGSLLTISDTSVTFDGISQYTEYIGCKDVVCENHTADVLPNDIVELTWSIPVESTFSDAYGNAVSPNTDELTLLNHYIVMMYVPTDSLDATYQRPGLNGGESENGTWYYMGRFEGNSARITCPRGLQVAFWVGFSTKDISTALTFTAYTS